MNACMQFALWIKIPLACNFVKYCAIFIFHAHALAVYFEMSRAYQHGNDMRLGR